MKVRLVRIGDSSSITMGANDWSKYIALVCLLGQCFSFLPNSSIRTRKVHLYQRVNDKDSSLLPSRPNTVGNFYELRKNNSFLQCVMLGTTNINGAQYGIGVPLHTPVLLITLNEKKEAVEVSKDYPHFEHLLDSISNQLESYDLILHDTPLYLTVEGEFEDEDDIGEDLVEYEKSQIREGENVDEEVPIEDVMEEFAPLLDKDEFDVEFDEEEPSEIPEDVESYVTAENSKSLHREANFLDKVMTFAKDVKYVGSFHYRKSNFHLLRLLDTQVVFGKRIVERKGFQFSLLDVDESNSVRPKLERLIRMHLLNFVPNLQSSALLTENRDQTTKAEPFPKRSWLQRNLQSRS